MTLTVTKIAKRIPAFPYEAMAQSILGKTYTLSLVFVGEVRAQKLNKQYRNASYVPNVLSFPLDTHTGEIYITPRIAEKEAKKHQMTRNGYIGFLFIHGLLHLKGYDHGSTMEKLERKFCTQYALH